jgi:hypothetical protein
MLSWGPLLPSYHPPPSHPIGSTHNPFVIMELRMVLGCNMLAVFMGQEMNSASVRQRSGVNTL